MIEVNSYIKHNDFYYKINDDRYKEFIGEIDWEYVEGGIEIIYYDNILFGFHNWDDINWFWGYVAYNFQSYFDNGEYSIGFPSQPINFIIKKIGERHLKLHIYSDSKVFTDINLLEFEFIAKFLQAAVDYFEFEKRHNNTGDKEIRLLRAMKF